MYSNQQQLSELIRLRQQDLMRAAQQDRLARQVLAHSNGRYDAYDRALAWLGQRLIVWGWQLQQRHNAACTPSALRHTNQARCQ